MMYRIRTFSDIRPGGYPVNLKVGYRESGSDTGWGFNWDPGWSKICQIRNWFSDKSRIEEEHTHKRKGNILETRSGMFLVTLLPL